MSAENGIYILETKGPEYRVAHCLDIDEFYHEGNSYNYNALYIFFKDSAVYASLIDAEKRAIELEKEISFTEYGICYISRTDYQFEKLDLQIPTCSKCGSEAIKIDSYSIWNVYTQTWELENTYDDYVCEVCRGECSVIWKKL
jgi:hypothetical protein